MMNPIFVSDSSFIILHSSFASASPFPHPANVLLMCLEDEPTGMVYQHVCTLRVRYSETDQMGTFYNSRALEWFECGRTELLRALGIPYAQMEERGALLPLVEAHVNYQGRARYDDPLKVTCSVTAAGKASLRFDVAIVHAETGNPITSGYTIHAVTDSAGKPARTPAWLTDAISRNSAEPAPAAGPKCPFCNDGKCIGACRD